MVQRTQQQFWFGCETEGLHLICLGVEQGASRGSLQGDKGVLGPPGSPALTPACFRAPHIMFIFQLPPQKKVSVGSLGCPIASQPSRDSSQSPVSPSVGTSERGHLGGLRTLKSPSNFLS